MANKKKPATFSVYGTGLAKFWREKYRGGSMGCRSILGMPWYPWDPLTRLPGSVSSETVAIEFRQHDQREETQGYGMEKNDGDCLAKRPHTPLKLNIFFTQSYEDETWKMMFLLKYSVMSRFNVNFQGCMFFHPPSLQIINHYLHPQIFQIHVLQESHGPHPCDDCILVGGFNPFEI